MRRHMVLAVSSLFLAAPVFAQQMNAESFHQRAVKLKGKGAMAMFSMGEVKALMKEGQAAGLAARNARLAAAKAGKPQRYCPPPGKQSMTSDEFMNGLAAIPQAERRRIDMTEATTRILERKFPCRA